MTIKLGRVMTYSEGFQSEKSCDCLVTWSQEVTQGRDGVTCCRRYIETLSKQKAHAPHILEDDYIVEDL